VCFSGVRLRLRVITDFYSGLTQRIGRYRGSYAHAAHGMLGAVCVDHGGRILRGVDPVEAPLWHLGCTLASKGPRLFWTHQIYTLQSESNPTGLISGTARATAIHGCHSLIQI
jgi:hypothetical protein